MAEKKENKLKHYIAFEYFCLMIQIRAFTLNPFQENTYVLYDESKEALIVDAGCSNRQEQAIIRDFIEKNELKASKLLNTHAHIDHVLGNKFIYDEYGLKTHLSNKEMPVFNAAEKTAQMYGLPYDHCDEIEGYIEEGDQIKWGNSSLETLWVPGHAPGHLVFYHPEQKFMIGGDVLFRGSIGRTDLPGGDHQTLLKMIRQKVFTLDEDMKVYSGHGDPTTIGYEKQYNPFF